MFSNLYNVRKETDELKLFNNPQQPGQINLLCFANIYMHKLTTSVTFLSNPKDQEPSHNVKWNLFHQAITMWRVDCFSML